MYTCALCVQGMAQEEQEKKSPFTVSAYGETYYIYDINKPSNNSRPAFVYSHNRVGEVNVNLAFIKAAYCTERSRAAIAIAAGSYMNANYVAEPGVLKNIYEANIGVKLLKNTSLWLDAGVMPSHIGFESAAGKDNWTVTRSMAADNSPYFETGARISYTSKNEQWYFAVLYLNGWQRIQRIAGTYAPSMGTQIMFKPSEKLTLNYSNFAGSDQPDSIHCMRYFHNLYGIFQLNKKIGITAGFDYGMEQVQKVNSNYNTWYAPVLITRYTPDDVNSFTVRGEYYRDKNNVIIAASSGFETFGWSLNYDRYLGNNITGRIEVRSLQGKDRYFIKYDNTITSNNTFITAAFTFNW